MRTITTCVQILLFLVISMVAQSAYEIKIFLGPAIEPHISYIADMRIKEFRPFPYLYEGSLADEIEYLKFYILLPHTAVAIAYENHTPVGLLTGTALTDFEEHFKGSTALFKKAGIDPTHYYYFGEIIIDPKHRGKGLTRKLFAALEAHAQADGFKHFCGATVVRDEQHPLKPLAYQSPDPIWRSMGYQKTDMVVDFDWTTIQADGSVKNESNPLVYWIK